MSPFPNGLSDRFGATCPSWLKRSAQRQALDTLTPNRAAARWQDAPSATAATTRARRSTDNGEGIASLLHPSTPQHLSRPNLLGAALGDLVATDADAGIDAIAAPLLSGEV